MVDPGDVHDVGQRPLLATLFAWYLRYVPVRKWKKAISGRLGPAMAGVPLATAYGFRMYTRFHDRTNRKAFQGNLGLLPRFVREVPRGACFVDIGANLGTIAIMAALQVGRGGRVLAFEPVPETYRELQRNIALNGLDNVVTYPMAIAARVAAIRMSPLDSMHSGAAHVDQAGQGDIRATPLAEVAEVGRAAEAGMPLYAKLDTEGYELEVLRGMRPLLERGVIVSLIVEIEHGHLARFGASAKDIYELLAEYGYRPRLHAQPVDHHYDEVFDRVVHGTRSSGNIKAK
jgi:FkbM family methyltransferase